VSTICQTASLLVISLSLSVHALDLFLLIEDVGEMAAAAVLAVVHGGHEDTSTACLAWTLPPQALDLAIAIDLVVLEHRQLGLLALVLDLLGGSVDLLLALLGTATQAQDEVESGLLLDVVVAQGAAVLELLAGEDEALLVWRDAFLVWNIQLTSTWSEVVLHATHLGSWI
jgi:hypothetical protein